MRLRVEFGDSSDVVIMSFDETRATVGDLAAALSRTTNDVLALDGVPYDSRVRLCDIDLVDGSLVSLAEDLRPQLAHARFWVGVVNGPGTGAVIRTNEGDRVAIGRAESNDLMIDNSSISHEHAVVHFGRAGEIELEDLGSHNGTWLAGTLVSSRTPIEPGQRFRMGSSTVRVIELDDSQRTSETSARHAERTGRVLVNRPPRPPVPSAPATIRPPASPEPPTTPTLAVISVVLPLVFAGAMVVALGSWRYAIFGLLSPVMAIGNWLSGRRRVRRQRASDGSAHADALVHLEREIDVAEQSERDRRTAFAPDILEIRERIEQPTARLWERRPDAVDAHTGRLGLGDVPWVVPTDGSKLSAEAAARLAAHETLADVEVVVDLRRGPIGLVGDAHAAVSAARSLVLQLAAHHGPADLRVAVLTTTGRLEQWAWVQWLPHGNAPDGSTHVLIGPDSHGFAANLLSSASSRADPTGQPDWLVVVDDVDLLHGRSSPARQALAADSVFGIVVTPTEDALPASVVTVVDIEAEEDGVFVLRTTAMTSETASGVLDLVSLEEADGLARSMARFEDPEMADRDRALPGLVSATDLFGDGLDADAVRTRWAAHEVSGGLVASIGETPHGVFTIDLVDDGPHGLVAGTTGAGKSELLRTLIVGLAVNHSPSQVVFVLIDYKGGSAFDRCAALPHVVGVVTDLDEHLAERALQSLDAELRSREEQFRRIGAENIDSYRLAAGDGLVVPRLVVVIDEFATLRNELPGFVDSLVSIAQRGRSLGVHLVLATQRPSGSVDANIRANTNLRIALRVQDGADSRDVIDSTVAAEIPRSVPGRAFVRRGGGDLVSIQAGFLSGRTNRGGSPVIVRRQTLGHGASTAVDDNESTSASNGDSRELDTLVEVVARASVGLPEPRRPWLDELPPRVAMADVADVESIDDESNVISIALGDDPQNQRRVRRNWKPTSGHLAAIGVTGSGVTTAIRQVIAALGLSDLGRDAWVFAADHAGGGLAGVDAWGHVSCCLEPTERERHERMLTYLDTELERRRALSPNASSRTPLLVLAIDGIAAFMDEIDAAPGTAASELLLRLGRDGPAFGIVLVIGARQLRDVPRALRGHVRHHLMFEQLDSSDFSVGAMRPGQLPIFTPGRALLSPDAMVCQVIDWETSVRDRAPELDRFPPVIEALETTISAARLSGATIDPDVVIPIGLLDSTRTQALLTLRPGEHATIAGPPGSGKTNALRLVAAQLRAASPELVIVGVAGGDQALLDAPELDAGGEVAEVVHILRMTSNDDRRWVILIDDADRIDVSDGPLLDLARTPPPNVTLFVALRASTIRGAYGHWTRAVRSSGVGLLLMPDVAVDGEVLGIRLPRPPAAMQSLPGRGFLVSGGHGEIVQVGMV